MPIFLGSVHYIEAFSAVRSIWDGSNLLPVWEFRWSEGMRAAIWIGISAVRGRLVHWAGVRSFKAESTALSMPFLLTNQGQIRIQLSGVLKGVISQLLLPEAAGNGRVAALEVMIVTGAAFNLIRDNQDNQLNSVLVRYGRVAREAAEQSSSNVNEFRRYL